MVHRLPQGPKEVDGVKVEGTFRAHQVPLAEVRTNPGHLKMLEEWMRSYRPEELFDSAGRLKPELAELAPQGTRRMGANPHTNGGVLLRELKIPDFREYAVKVPSPGAVDGEDTRVLRAHPAEEMAGAQAHFAVELRELREKVLPDLDADFVGSLGDFADVEALRADVKTRLERNALDRARHGFADRIIEYAVANATLELPDVLVDQEVEVMHDEFRATLARQGITEEAYLKALDKTDADMHAEFRPGAEKRVKTLLVLSKVADAENVTVPDAEVDAEIARGRERYADDARLQEYFDSERGRAYIRSTLRRSRVVEGLIDEWLAAHPEHAPLPHLEDGPESAVAGGQAAANASIDATDPGAILEDVPAAAG
jgi:hypothetical protein